MNSKLMLCLLVWVAGTAVLSGQKITTEKFPVQYTALPLSPLNPEFTTFSSSCYGGGSTLADLGITPTSLANQIKFEGFKKVEGKSGHFRVNIQIGYMRIGRETTEKRISTTKKKDGTEVKTTYYYKKSSYSIPISYRVTDYEGKVLKEGTVSSNTSTQAVKSKEYTSYSSLNNYWQNNRHSLIYGAAKKFVIDRVGSIQSTLAYAYDYRKITYQKDELEVPGKKVDGFEAFNGAYETVKTAFEGMRPNEPITDMAPQVQSAIDFWKNALDDYPMGNKKSEKMRHACLMNLSTVYYWLEDLAQAEKYATECLQISWKDGRPKRLLKEIEAVKKKFDINKIKTRHINRDLANAEPPSSSAEEEVPVFEETGDLAEMEGYILNEGGDTLNGKFVVNTAEDMELNFGPDGNVVFTYQIDGKDEKSTLDPATVKGFQLKDRNFMAMTFTPGDKGNKEAGTHLMECIYDTERIKVFKFYPYDNKLGDVKMEYAFQKATDEAPISTSSTQFLLFKKGMSKYFADCPDLAELAGAGEFENEEESLIQAARIFAEVCE